MTLYEKTVGRHLNTNLDEDERILSAYDMILMEGSFTVIYRTGGTKNFKWKEVLPVANRKAAEQKKKELEKMGYKSIIHKTNDLKTIGLPSTYEGEDMSGEPLNEAMGKEKTKEIRDVLKSELGLTNRDVSVRYDGSIRVTLKTVKSLPYRNKIKEVAEEHESYQRDQATGAILRGGNTFVFVELDWKFRNKLTKQIEAEISKKVTDEFMYGKGGGNTIKMFGQYEIFKDRQSKRDEFRVIHPKESSAGPPQYSIMDAAGRLLWLMLSLGDEKNLKKLKG